MAIFNSKLFVYQRVSKMDSSLGSPATVPFLRMIGRKCLWVLRMGSTLLKYLCLLGKCQSQYWSPVPHSSSMILFTMLDLSLHVRLSFCITAPSHIYHMDIPIHLNLVKPPCVSSATIGHVLRLKKHNYWHVHRHMPKFVPTVAPGNLSWQNQEQHLQLERFSSKARWNQRTLW